ncbi:MAG TPA: hypothetical protein PLO43_00060, partial [Chlamydiales bacterium]|nr:hypothetical protein [Chlamydiales bacterium]
KVLSTESGQRAALMVSDCMELPLVRYCNATYYFPLNFSSAVAEAFLASEFLQNMLKIQGAQGLTLVHFAAQREWEGFRRMGRPMPIGHPHFIELFLKYPAGREALEIQDDLGSTPLHIAAAWTYYVGIESIINQTMSAKIFTMKTTSGHTFADLFIGSEVSYFGDNTQAIARREAIELAKQRCITLQTADSKQKKSVEKSLRYLQSLD